MARASDYDHYDESFARIRPSRSSRPRSKDRPSHDDSVTGRVLGVDRGRYRVLIGDRTDVLAMRARALRSTSIVVGDSVELVGDTSGGPDALARIVSVNERASTLRRTADDTDPVERVIVANADQLAIVAAVANPEPRRRLIDRCLVAAYDADLDPLLILTKSDLADRTDLFDDYAALDVVTLATSISGHEHHGLGPVREALADRVTVLVGHSGVGKSTLVNALVPEAERSTGSVNVVTGRGRHTSTSAVALPLPNGGWVIDTPGIRSFGLAHVDPDTLIDHFPDLAAGAANCPRRCSHDEPDCALDEFVTSGEAGTTGARRLDSLRRLLRSRSVQEGD